MRHTLRDQRTISELISEAQHRLAQGPHPERARLDAEALLVHIVQQHSLQRNRAWLLANRGCVLLQGTEKRFFEFIARRVSGEPIQYITGECEFYGLPLHVTRDVLIPRPETEHLVENAMQLCERFAKPRIVDIGTGSGGFAVALATHLRTASITATDISAAAIAVARRNAKRNGVADRIRFLEGDLLAPVANERFDMIISNPPYVPEGDRDSLPVEVRAYEPQQALFAGPDGLAVYRRLIPAAFAALAPGGFVVLEIGYGQQTSIRALLAGSGFERIGFTSDLKGIPRVAFARRG